MAEYAKVIVDISQEKLDKTFEYRHSAVSHTADRSRNAGLYSVWQPAGSPAMLVELSDEAEY